MIKSPEEAVTFGQELVQNGYLRTTGQFQKQFQNKDNFYYRWQKTESGVFQEKIHKAEGEVSAYDRTYRCDIAYVSNWLYR